jgi:hypothetical protein
VGVLLSVLSLLVVWMARTGHNWARMVLIFFSAFIVVQTVLGLFGDSASSWTTIPAVLSGVAALGAAWLLMQRDVEAHCRAMAAFRKGGAIGGPPTGHPQAPYPQGPQQPYQPYQPPQQSYRPPTQPGHDPSARYDPHAHDPQGPPRYTPPPTAPTPYGAPPPLYPSYPDPRSADAPQPGGWEPARGENVRERRPGRPDDGPADRPDTSSRDDRGE